WIDGIRKRVDEQSYAVRFTPRKTSSNWSVVNIARVKVLKGEGRMKPAGLAAFSRRRIEKSATYSFENRESAKLSAEQEREFQHHPKAWQFYQNQPPGYRRMSAWWVTSAKRPETRQIRLQRLISHSEAHRRIY
ncbi:MAG: bacteriocin-protection protein, partial [Chthoniobacterales bacterium]